MLKHALVGYALLSASAQGKVFSLHRHPIHRLRSAVVETLEGRTLLAFSAYVNFQPASAKVPSGYLADSGAVYAKHGSYSYGWKSVNNHAVDRNQTSDQRYDTFDTIAQSSLNWEMAIPNGTYNVRIVAGDPSATNSFYSINAEGVSVVKGQPTSGKKWVDGTAAITVKDGRLTISNGSGAQNNKIDFVDISQVSVASVPTAPVGMTATVQSSHSVALAWTDTATTETGYLLERSVDGGSYAQLASLTANSKAFVDSAVGDGHVYGYRIAAFNGTGSSASAVSNTATIALALPTSFIANAATGQSVALQWADNSLSETGYQLERSTGSGDFVTVATLAANSTSFTDSVADGATYQYRISILSPAGKTIGATAGVTLPLMAPTNLTATSAADVPKVALSWVDRSGSENRYLVDRSTDGTSYKPLVQLPAGSTSYVDSVRLEASTTYTYRVTAVNAATASAPAVSSATTANFRLFDAMTNAHPSLTTLGFNDIVVGYEWTGTNSPTSLLTADKSAAIQANVQFLADQAATAGVPLVLDVESWPLVPSSTVTKQTAAANIGRIIQMIQWARAGHPNLQIGFYGFPHPAYGNYNTADGLSAYRKTIDFLTGIDPDSGAYNATQDLYADVDFISPGLYARTNDVVGWEQICDVVMSQARRVANSYAQPKPVYPFIWMDYDGAIDAVTGKQEINADAWAFILGKRRIDSDGVILWSAPSQTWDGNADWWTATTDFLNASAAAPSSPADLLLKATGMSLTWTDTCASEDGFEIQRSTDGIIFSTIGKTIRNCATWSDTSYTVGTKYWYRVVAFDGTAASMASNVVSAVATRNAFSVNQAENFDTTNRDWRYASGVSVSGGSWLGYKAVDFGTGASSISLRIALEAQGAGRSVQIWIDGLDTGTLIGTRTLDVTGGWGTLVDQSILITPVSGVHDVYFRFIGGLAGTSAFDSFQAH